MAGQVFIEIVLSEAFPEDDLKGSLFFKVIILIIISVLLFIISLVIKKYYKKKCLLNIKKDR